MAEGRLSRVNSAINGTMVTLTPSEAKKAGIKIPRARANVSRIRSQYDSDVEEEWARIGAVVLGDHIGKRIMYTDYHPFTLNLVAARYAPDWLHIDEDGGLICVETKGDKRQKNIRDARSKLRAAAARFPWMRFFEATYQRQDRSRVWLLREITTV